MGMPICVTSQHTKCQVGVGTSVLQYRVGVATPSDALSLSKPLALCSEEHTLLALFEALPTAWHGNWYYRWLVLKRTYVGPLSPQQPWCFCLGTT